MNKEPDAACQGDEGAEVEEQFACRDGGRNRIPYRREIGPEKADRPETDHGDREGRVNYACDTHRHVLPGAVQFGAESVCNQ